MADNTLATLGANSPVSIKSISSLYILKALLAFVVVTLHCPLGVVPWLHIPGLEVNLFFAITGYFLYSEDREKVFKRIGKSIKKVIPIILVLQLVYYCLAPFPLPSVFSSYMIYFRWIFIGFVYFEAGPLWYMNALLYGLLFFWGYLKLFKGRYVPLLMGLSVLWTVWTLVRFFILHEPMDSVFNFNFLTRAVPFLAMGYWIRYREAQLLRYNWLVCYLLLLVASGLEFAFSGVATNGGASFSFINPILLPFALFMLFLKYKELGSGTPIEVIGARYSAMIYYVHYAIKLLWVGLNDSHPMLRSLYERGGALFVFFISLMIAVLIERGELLAKRLYKRN